MKIDDFYTMRVKEVSDINEHLPILKSFSKGVVVELGVRYFVSTWALLAGRPKKLVSIDIKHPQEYGGDLKEVEDVCKKEGLDFQFILGSSLEVELIECDVLFIDTLHTYKQLTAELKRWSPYVNKYILMHDTNMPEMKQAIDEFLGDWKVEMVLENNNGLMILSK